MSIVSAFAVCHPPLILPFVDREGDRFRIQKTIDSYKEVARRVIASAPETVIITSPHATAYSDYFHISPGRTARGSMRRFGVRGHGLSITYDTDLVSAIVDAAAEDGIPAGTDGEREVELDHATYIPLWFLAEELGMDDGDCDLRDVMPVVRIGLSGLDALDHYRFGQTIAKAVGRLDRRVVFIASGDLSHKLLEDGPYGFAEEGPEFDRRICEAFDRSDFGELLAYDPTFAEKAAECGLRSFEIMAGALDGLALSGGLLSYEGPFGVGYGMAAWDVVGTDDGRRFGDAYRRSQAALIADKARCEDPYVRLARASVTSYVLENRELTLDEASGILGDLPSELLDTRAGTFVSLHERGRLRGCIGTIEPTSPSVAEEILRNAVSACAHDPRFPPVRPDELDQLSISVDMLGEPEPIESAAELDVRRYGVIVTKGMRRGLLLPDLEGVGTPGEQIAIARRKAGISENEHVTLERFEVVRHE